jgi:sacsin
MELQRVAFLPAANGTRLVTANSLFVRLTINLSPFAFELSSLYLPFVKILKDLGLQDVLSVTSAKDILLKLQKACGYQRLNPNELRAVMEVLHFVCETVESDGSIWNSEAIVPDDGCRLVQANSCVYIDAYGSRYVKCIDTSRLRFVHPHLPEGICIVLGIKKLSDVVIEVA